MQHCNASVTIKVPLKQSITKSYNQFNVMWHAMYALFHKLHNCNRCIAMLHCTKTDCADTMAMLQSEVTQIVL